MLANLSFRGSILNELDPRAGKLTTRQVTTTVGEDNSIARGAENLELELCDY